LEFLGGVTAEFKLISVECPVLEALITGLDRTPWVAACQDFVSLNPGNTRVWGRKNL